MAVVEKQPDREYLKKMGVNPDLWSNKPIKESFASTGNMVVTGIKRQHSHDSFENVEPISTQDQNQNLSSFALDRSIEVDIPGSQSPKSKPKQSRVRNTLIRKGKFKSAGLSQGNLATYHARELKEFPEAEKLIRFYERDLINESQATKFEHGGKKYLAIACISTVRIFEFTRGDYSEVKRVPERFMKLSSNIITCIHFNENKLFIAYLWGNKAATEEDTRESYIEIRDLNGELNEGPIYTKHPVRSMHSDQDYTYFITTANTIHAHPKSIFYATRYNLNPIHLTNDPIKFFYVRPMDEKLTTTMLTVAATEKEILIGRMTNLPDDSNLVRVFRFQDDLHHRSKITTCHYVDGLNKLVIVRKVDPESSKTHNQQDDDDAWHPSAPLKKREKQQPKQIKSLISIGSIQGTTGEPRFFVHELTLTFQQDLLQTRLNRKKLYVHGRRGNSTDETEIICIDLDACRLDWVNFTQVATNSRVPYFNLLCHDNQIVKVRNYREIEYFNVARCNYCKDCSLTFATKADLDHHIEIDSHLPVHLKFEVLINKSLSQLK